MGVILRGSFVVLGRMAALMIIVLEIGWLLAEIFKNPPQNI
jgi:hypothetical protein